MKLPNKFVIILILKLYPLLVVIELGNISIPKELNMENVCNAIWELKIMELSCPMPIKKMLLMPWLMPPLEPLDKDAWPSQLLSSLVKLKNGLKISSPKPSPSKSAQATRKE